MLSNKIPYFLDLKASILINMALRGMTLVTRFALTLYIAKFLGIEAVGVFGLILGIVSLAPPLVGFAGNYIFSRESVGKSRTDAGRLLRDRLVLSIGSLCAAVALYLLMAWSGLAPLPSMIAATVLIVVLDTLACDIQVWLIAQHKALHANAMMFIRTSAWALIVMAFGFFNPAFNTLSIFIYAWAAFEALQFLYLLWVLRSWPLQRIAQTPISFKNIWANIIKGRWVYVNECCLALAIYVDRFIVHDQLGLEITGFFTLYWSIANGVYALVSTGIVQPAMPHLVSAFHDKKTGSWQATFRALMIKTTGATIAIGTLVLGCLAVVFPLVDIGSFETYWPFAVMLLIATVFNALSNVSGLGLASRHLDNHFAFIGIAGLIVSLTFNVIGISFWGIEGAAIAAIGTHALLFALKARVLGKHSVH